MHSTPQQVATIKTTGWLSEDDDYSLILQTLGLKYKPVDYYWQVGEITKTQGWILHLSVVLSEIREMLENIIPILVNEEVPFKIAMTEFIAEDILSGNFGLAKIGKVVSIYPSSDVTALTLAKQLIESAKSYKGPNIPTDIRLGAIVFTRYGSFNPIIKLNTIGNEEKYIYDGTGQLVKDLFAIPFQLPKGVAWPFQQLTEPKLPERPKLLNHVYKLIDILKPDQRGNVFKGLYVKNFFQVKNCVIKQGFSGMSSDKAGRDIQDRLIWQYELYKDLSDIVPLPVIYDLFKEQNSTVLVMEFIKGDSLFDRLAQINRFSTSGQDLPSTDFIRVLQYAAEITRIIDRMHQRGYVHRDIVPVNFLIDKKDKIILIDIELAYSLKTNNPNPPFKLGTFGFMSPEQEALQRPTVYEDIYGIGATLLYLFTGIYPIKFNKQDTKLLSNNLYFFIGNKKVAHMIANCLHFVPQSRPSITHIREVLAVYQMEAKAHIKSTELSDQDKQSLNKYSLEHTITSALNGLNKSPIVIQNNIWYSKQITVENYTANKTKQYSISQGFSEGISGVLYVLARMNKAGISVASCVDEISKSWRFIENNYLNRLPELPAGLYRGSAGLALALAQSLEGGLLEDNPVIRRRIQECLAKAPEDINLTNGIAGQGLSLLQCKHFVEKDFFETRLNDITGKILSKQLKDGSWSKYTGNCLDIRFDDTGILCFLLAYYSLFRSEETRKSIIKGLTRIISDKKGLKKFYDLIASQESYDLGDGGKGLIFTFIRAYEILNENIFRKLAEDALLKYPRRIIHNNMTQENGLAAIGEIYLEAWRVFKNDEWKHRTDWIANVFIHSLLKTEIDVGHWVMEQNNPPTADFLTGNSGIIHFLSRCLEPTKIGYRILTLSNIQ